MISTAKFSAEEIDTAHRLFEMERVKEIDLSSIYSAGIYCILAIGDRWITAERTHRKIKKRFKTPEYTITHLKELRPYLDSIRWYNEKFIYIKNFSLWWVGTKAELPLQILNDLQNGREKEFELRNAFAKGAPGFQEKGASLLLLKLGYENVVPVDHWESIFLKSMGYDIKVGDYKTVSGPRGKEYLEYESIIREFAEKQGIKPYIFHLALLARNSRSSKLLGMLRDSDAITTA